LCKAVPHNISVAKRWRKETDLLGQNIAYDFEPFNRHDFYAVCEGYCLIFLIL
jgi:hypothetical protein